MSTEKTTIAGDPWPERNAGRSASTRGSFDFEPGRHVGPYKLLGRLGEGGFGLVFVADQEEPVKRRVALKVIKPGMDSRAVIARFEAERQALAVMDHPCVAKVFDAGETERGLPYFVMEYVQGEPITSFCDRQNFTTRERLDLFMRVCDAVQHAHQKGIIHRDLKPTNVLVTMVDGKPLPKVIDFGIAKAIGAGLTEKTIYTERGQMIGTPEYMSPEQAEMSTPDIDTRTDVYSLGVLLYEVLTGALPFDSRRLRSAAFGEMQKIIREVDPPMPSRRLSTLGPGAGAEVSWRGGFTGTEPPEAEAPVSVTADDLARKRKTDPGGLARQLRGDLDWITMKAIEKDRERRYDSPAALAADVRRHLANEPVLAGPPSAVYRMSKFARRNKGLIVAASVVLLTLAGGLVGTSYGFVQAREQRDAAKLAQAKADASAAKATEEAAKAKAVNKFLEDMLQSADPSQSQGEKLTVREMLDRSVATIDAGSFKDQPEVESSVRGAIGTTYHSLGLYDQAEPQMRRAMEMAEKIYGPDHEATASARHDFGTLLLDQGKYTDAEKMFASALAIRRAHPGENDSELSSTLNSMAAVLQELGKLPEAEALCRESLDIERRIHADGHARHALALNNLGMLLLHLERPEEGLPFMRESLEMRKRVQGENHPEYAQAVNNFGGIMMGMKRFDEAERYFREAVVIRRRVMPPDHPELASSINNVGGSLYMQGKFEAAEPFLREAFEIRSKSLPANHPNLTSSLRNLARVAIELKHYDQAEKMLLDAYAKMGTNPDTPAAFVTGAASDLARMYQEMGKPEKAAEWKGKAGEK